MTIMAEKEALEMIIKISNMISRTPRAVRYNVEVAVKKKLLNI